MNNINSKRQFALKRHNRSSRDHILRFGQSRRYHRMEPECATGSQPKMSGWRRPLTIGID